MLYTAFLLGLTGSLHCAGMCSPLLMTVTNLKSKAARNRWIYNAGRIFTYALLGAVISTIGSLLPIARYQNILSVGFGIALVVFAAFRIMHLKANGMGNLASWIKRQFSSQLVKKNTLSVFIMGMLNGLVPCGLSIAALTYCILLERPVNGFIFMIFFGLGTIPMMIGFAPFILNVIKRFNWSIQKFTTTMMILSGIMLIANSIMHSGVGHQHKAVVDITLCRGSREI